MPAVGRGEHQKASTPHTAYITHTLLFLLRVREQGSQSRKIEVYFSRRPLIATLGTGSFLRLGLGHQEDRWKVTP